MKYALGNMLNGAGSLNPDGLSLDLQFAADKTLTARKGPTPVFTRASTATFVGSNGLIQSAAINAPRFDHDPLTLACKGLLIEESRTNLVFPSEALTTQTRTVTAVVHTLSFYGTGTVVLSGSHSATVVGTAAYPTRTTLTFTPTAGSLTLTVTGSVTQAQLEAGSFATSYIPTTTGSVVRSADVCSITGASSTFDNTDGTLFTIGAALFISSTQSNNICSIDSGTTGQLRIFNRAAQAGRLSTMVSNVILTPAANYNTAGVFYKAAIAANASGADYVIDGTQIPDTYTGSSITADNLKITGAGGTTTNSWISSIRYYKKRLPVSKLQTLTT